MSTRQCGLSRPWHTATLEALHAELHFGEMTYRRARFRFAAHLPRRRAPDIIIYCRALPMLGFIEAANIRRLSHYVMLLLMYDGLIIFSFSVEFL